MRREPRMRVAREMLEGRWLAACNGCAWRCLCPESWGATCCLTPLDAMREASIVVQEQWPELGE
jgi:transposase